MSNMKKFVGNVNGKEYSCKEEFEKAANEALASNDGLMFISSHYTECDCDCDEDCSCKSGCKCGCDCKCVEEKVEKTPLDFNTLLLNVNSKKNVDGSYIVPNDDIFINVSNLDEIYKKLGIEKDKLVNNNIRIECEIEDLNKNKYDNLKKFDYYSKLQDNLSVYVEEESKYPLENEESKTEDTENKETLESLLNEIAVGFNEFLNNTGFWK